MWWTKWWTNANATTAARMSATFQKRIEQQMITTKYDTILYKSWPSWRKWTVFENLNRVLKYECIDFMQCRHVESTSSYQLYTVKSKRLIQNGARRIYGAPTESNEQVMNMKWKSNEQTQTDANTAATTCLIEQMRRKYESNLNQRKEETETAIWKRLNDRWGERIWRPQHAMHNTETEKLPRTNTKYDMLSRLAVKER